jgi:hypothetical protein
VSEMRERTSSASQGFYDAIEGDSDSDDSDSDSSDLFYIDEEFKQAEVKLSLTPEVPDHSTIPEPITTTPTHLPSNYIVRRKELPANTVSMDNINIMSLLRNNVRTL